MINNSFKFHFLVIFLFWAGQLYSQKFSISGFVSDSLSKESLIQAAIFNPESKSGTVSNSYGFFSLLFNKGRVEFHVSYVGYKSKIFYFDLQKDTTLAIYLEPSTELSEIQVTNTSIEKNLRSTQTSTIEIPVKTFKSMPLLFGEADILKVLQYTPGVKGGNEGSSGIYVRGGSP